MAIDLAEEIRSKYDGINDQGVLREDIDFINYTVFWNIVRNES